MKTKFTLLALLAQFFVLAASAAYDFTTGGVYYNVTKTPSSSEPGAVTVVSGTDQYSGTVTIPASVTNDSKTYNVTAIADKAFQNCIHLRAINIGSNVTSIGYQAFQGCEEQGSG